ncbi:MAG: transposase [Acidobacteriota bacterium]
MSIKTAGSGARQTASFGGGFDWRQSPRRRRVESAPTLCWSYCRSWLKLHLCVDETTLESLRAVASTNNLSDAEVLPDLLEDIAGTIDQVSADGAYDQRKCYDDLNRHQAKAANRESIQRTVIENCAPEPNDSSRNARHHQD